MYKVLANKYYKNHKLYHKAFSAATAMDNSMKLEYSKGGTTNTHFMISNYLAYFDYEVLKNRGLI